MAQFISPTTISSSKMTAGERRFAHCLNALLEDDYLIWFDVPIGTARLHPDFIILHPRRGLLILEVKDWKLENLLKLDKLTATIQTANKPVNTANPLAQARQYLLQVCSRLQTDPQLVDSKGKFAGRLCLPYGYGAVLSNITSTKMQRAISDSDRESVIPDRHVIYKNHINSKEDPERFQKRLWDMFDYQFGEALTLPQIDRIRWHLFPELRISCDTQALFEETETEATGSTSSVAPDLFKVMDLQQEQLARSLGEGHRVIHGVAGSGKTLILGFRCQYLAQRLKKPILVLCYNITLAAQLRKIIEQKQLAEKVKVYHFHDWCKQQLQLFSVPLIESEQSNWERQVASVISGVEKGLIPHGQYGAVMIDEGHDFEADWLKLVVQMVDEKTQSLLLMYDDAQSIYKKNTGLGFTLSSTGVQAKGRTTILRLNYRNSQEILDFAYRSAMEFLTPHDTDEDHIPLLAPESAGISGEKPVVHLLTSQNEELEFIARCIKKWFRDGIRLSTIAVLAPNKQLLRLAGKALNRQGLPTSVLAASSAKANYDPSNESVAIMTIHSSKGLEFPRVILIGAGYLGKDSDTQDKQKSLETSRLLYVGMTRAQSYLLLTSSIKNDFTKKLLKSAA